MDIERILEDFAVPEGFPREAVAAATADREAVLPRFLKELEDFGAGVDDPEVPSPAFCIFHLLGSWGETRGYRAMARALLASQEHLEWTFGDSMTETVHRCMLNVFDGDPQPLYDIIEAERAHPWIRSRMIEVLALLARQGRLPRDEVLAWLRAAPERLEPRDTHEIWIGWQSAIAFLGAAELTDRVRQAFKDQWIEPGFMEFKDFMEDLRRIQADPDDPRVVNPGEYGPFGDFEEETGSWNWNLDEDVPEADPDRTSAFAGRLADVLSQEPAVNPYRNVGRNDPCPCGSGRKFKKCCGA